MLDRRHRLPQSVSFKDAGVVSSQAFLIKTKVNSLTFSRASVIVSKKIEKKAVGRNRIKRQARSYLEKILPDIKEGRDILIIARKEAREKTTEQICGILEKSFKDAGII